jgi:hypothetical protein
MKVVFILLILALPLFGAFEYIIPDVNLISTSESIVVSNQLPSAYLLNPAVSSQVQNNHFSLFYTQPYGVPGLMSGAFISHYRSGRYGFGFTTTVLGNEIYRENQLVGNISREFFDRRLAVGVNLRWNLLSVENYGSLSVLGVDAGLQYQLQRGILMGFAVRNINHPQLTDHAEQLPIVTQWGMSFQLTDRFDTYIALSKDSWYPLSVRIGVLMRINSILLVHSGFNSNPAIPSFGLTLKHHWISVQYGLQYHFDLGGTHVWGLSFER